MCKGWLWKCSGCGKRKLQLHTRCSFQLFCKKTYEKPTRDGTYTCRGCKGYYATESIERVDKESSKPKIQSQGFTFFDDTRGGPGYEAVSETTTYYDNRRRRPAAPDQEDTGEPGDDVPPDSGDKGSKRKHGRGRRRQRRSRRESEAEGYAPAVEAAEVSEHAPSPVRRDASLGSAAAASDQLPPLSS